MKKKFIRWSLRDRATGDFYRADDGFLFYTHTREEARKRVRIEKRVFGYAIHKVVKLKINIEIC